MTKRKDTRTGTELLTVDKDKVAQVRKGIREEFDPDAEVIVVTHKLSDATFMPVIAKPPANSLKDLFKWFLFGAINEQDLFDRLMAYGIDPRTLANNLWLKKVLMEYFYRGTFKTLMMVVDSYQPKTRK